MKELIEIIRTKATVVPEKGIIKSTALNQKFDPKLYTKFAKEVKKYFDMKKVSLILTSEASGIPFAAFVAKEYNIPFIFARKQKAANVHGGVYEARIHSYTFDKDVCLVVAKKLMNAKDKVLIADDVIANGSACMGLINLIKQAKAKPVGIISLMEKKFQKGGDNLRKKGYKVTSLATILAMDEDGTLHFEGDKDKGENKYAKTKKTIKCK